MKKLIIGMLGSSLVLAMGIAHARTYTSYLCATGIFSCITVQKGQSWETLFPNAADRDIVEDLNRIDTRLYPGRKLAVPYDLNSLDKLDLAPFPPQRATDGQKTIVVNPNQLAWGAYNAAGELVNWGAASTGRAWCPDIGQACRTAVGQFSIFRKEGAGCKSGTFPIETHGGARMPFCMYFHDGDAVHGS